MNRDRLGWLLGNGSWRALAVSVLWLALASHGQEGGAKPGAAVATGDLQAAMTVDLGGGVNLDLILVRPGSFQMGGAVAMPMHKVTLTKPFYLGKYEVTRAQWQAAMGANPSSNKGPKLPVTDISWEDCQQFLAKLGEGGRVGAGAFRLPTEAEWEYACRAGTTTAYCCGDGEAGLDEYAWLDGNSGKTAHEVGTKKPNAWGLYDMHGNVWEWCSDWYGAYTGEAATDPAGAAQSSARVGRGGSWAGDAGNCRSAGRCEFLPDIRGGDLGFRVAFAPAVQP